jgi:hypothetical protein
VVARILNTLAMTDVIATTAKQSRTLKTSISSLHRRELAEQYMPQEISGQSRISMQHIKEE